MLSKHMNGNRFTCMVVNSYLLVPIHTKSNHLPFRECQSIQVIHKLPDATPDHVHQQIGNSLPTCTSIQTGRSIQTVSLVLKSTNLTLPPPPPSLPFLIQQHLLALWLLMKATVLAESFCFFTCSLLIFSTPQVTADMSQVGVTPSFPFNLIFVISFSQVFLLVYICGCSTVGKDITMCLEGLSSVFLERKFILPCPSMSQMRWYPLEAYYFT